MDKQQWQAFVDDRPAREAAEAKWLEQHAKLEEAERLLFDERWTTDDPWPGVIYRGPTGDGIKAVDVETWTLMHALLRGMGEALLRQDRDRKAQRKAKRPWPHGGTMNDDIAGQGPIERPVRPRVWMDARWPQWDTADSFVDGEEPQTVHAWVPLYDDAALQERCARSGMEARRAERERLRGYFRDALADTGITWPGEVDILYDKCFGAPYVPDEAA